MGPEARDLGAMSNDASDGSSPAVLSLAGIREAADRISPHTQVTPVMTCGALNEMSGREVFFKCELFQKTGSFKARGACNAVLLTPPECPCVVTHSSGNHAQVPHLLVAARTFSARIVGEVDRPRLVPLRMPLIALERAAARRLARTVRVGDTWCKVASIGRRGMDWVVSFLVGSNSLRRRAVKQKNVPHTKLWPPQSPSIVCSLSTLTNQALSWAASVRGIPAHIVMPRSCMAVKVDAVRGYGAR